MRTIARFKLAFVTLMTAIVLLVSARARAEFTPPPFTSSVVDQAGKLSAGEHSYLTAMIERHRRATGFVVAVYLPASLEGEAIEDVAYKTARAWKLGDQGKDNGVLLVIAPAERKIRIETGKGVGGALTDLQTNVILRERVGPQLKQEHFREAIAAGIEGIYAALAKDPSAAPVPQKRPGTGPQPVSGGIWFVLVPVFIFFMLFMLVMRFVSRLRGRRHRGYYDDRGGGGGGGGTFIPPVIFPIGGGGGGGGGSDWGGGGGGGGDSGGGGGGDFGGGSSGDYGGGGDFGGGGSSDNY